MPLVLVQCASEGYGYIYTTCTHVWEVGSERAVDGALEITLVEVAVAAQVEAERPVWRHLEAFGRVHELPILGHDRVRPGHIDAPVAAAAAADTREEEQVEHAADRAHRQPRVRLHDHLCERRYEHIRYEIVYMYSYKILNRGLEASRANMSI